jgi:hypothetical protein
MPIRVSENLLSNHKVRVNGLKSETKLRTQDFGCMVGVEHIYNK